MTDLRALLAARTAPGTWARGYWHGQCHQHEVGKHPGPPKCKYDYTFEADYETDHRIVAGDHSTVAGNYDYEEGGIVLERDARAIVAMDHIIDPALAVVEAAREDMRLLHHFVHDVEEWETCEGSRCRRRRAALAAFDAAVEEATRP